ncbi:hypothetical protein U1708_02915 [Sphingomonas sp. ZB1N12]|uniref:hypothetical protein n=1 Tax=Sphingomonas arabinosi TaxID=3096160 RepID=UPI002FCA264A
MTDKRTSELVELMAESRLRLLIVVEHALDNDYAAVALADDEGELRRQSAVASRRSQRNSLEHAIRAIALKFADPREDPERLRDDVDDLRRSVFMLSAEIDDLQASTQMRYPSASQVANVSGAVGVLEARIGASAAAGAIMRATAGVLEAWPL